jgi:photosystem II stability/assembly factor-like uncharacterized protein
MPQGTGPTKVREIVAATVSGENVYTVLLVYWETEAAQAVGQILRSPVSRQGQFVCDLNTNNQLRNMWSSSTGSLWVGSSDGNMWTTARVSWPPPSDETESDQTGALTRWTATRLPDMRKHGIKPIMTCVWGTADDDVYVGTFEGGVYHWNGRAWDQVFTDVSSAINHIHGSAPDDIYAVGEEGVVLHFDGTAWRRLPYPGDGGRSDGLTGVRAIGRHEVYICGRSGRILHGSRRGLEVLGEFEPAFYGLGYFRKRVLLAAGDDGVWELAGNTVSPIKDNIGTVGIFEQPDLVFFVEPAQTPTLIEYAPDQDPPWWRRVF